MKNAYLLIGKPVIVNLNHQFLNDLNRREEHLDEIALQCNHYGCEEKCGAISK
jgi:hypothetical protein